MGLRLSGNLWVKLPLKFTQGNPGYKKNRVLGEWNYSLDEFWRSELKNIERTEKYITEAGLNNSSAKLVPRNSVVIALAGQGKTRGKVARIRIALATNQSLAALTFDEKKFSSDYVFHF